MMANSKNFESIFRDDNTEFARIFTLFGVKQIRSTQCQ